MPPQRPIDKLKEFVEQEENETIIAEVVEYVKVLKAFRKLEKEPPSPKVWERLPRWIKIFFVWIAESEVMTFERTG